MIVIIFSGSRYADWRLADKGQVIYGFRTSGINSYLQDERYINQLLNKDTNLIYNAEKIKKIYFFGAGVSSKERQKKIEDVFHKFFKNAKAKANHDIFASAISTLGDESGIVGIIGSGSNAAYYNGKKIQPNNFGLGYILGDEGSTNWIGKKLLKDFLTDNLPPVIREKLLLEYDLDRKAIFERIYHHPNPNLYLTSFSEFIFENKEELYINNLIKKGLDAYVKTYLIPLAEEHPDSKFGFTGSVANNYPDLLKAAAENHHIKVGTIIKDPIQQLVKYYLKIN